MLDSVITRTLDTGIGPEQGPADDELMRSIAKGDKTAFTFFLRRHLRPLVAFANRYMNARSDAEDIAQEAMTRVWTHAERWREIGSSPRSWLYRIAYNLCIDEIRKRKTVVDDYVLVDDSTPERLVEQQLNELSVRAAIHKLPERQRSALWLSAYHGLSNKEAAEILDTTIEAMESLLTRARRSLRQELNLIDS